MKVYPPSYYRAPYNGQPSERDYEEIPVVESVYFGSNDYGDPDVDSEKVSLYKDPETGIVVADVFAYEAWLKRITSTQ